MANYIVDPVNGIDTSSGLTESTSWKTLLKASDTLISGDTARLRGGVYLPNDGNAGLRTKRNGTAGAPITFRAYGTEVPIIKHQYIGIMPEHSYITLVGLAVINDSQGTMETGICHWENHGAISHVIVDGCAVRNIKPGDPSHGIRLENISYGTVRNCAVDHVGTPPQPGPEGGNGLWITGNYCLVEDNKFDYCGHAGMFIMGDRMIARRNDCNGTWGVCAEYLSYNTTAFRSLIEDNIFRNASFLQQGLWRNPSWQQMGSGSIVRRNVIYGGIGSAMQIYSRADYQSWHNRFYHNVVYRCGGTAPPSYLGTPYEIQEDVAGTQGDNIVKNSIHYLNSRNDRASFAGTGNQGVIAFLTNTWNDINPRFVGEADRDFRLSAGSPCIDSGEFLTRTRAAGSGQILPVVDASYFCDGWGIIEGDYIQLEGTDYCTKVLNIDYTNNVLNLSDSLTFSAGQGVSLPFIGTKPDIGAFEYIGEIMATHSIDVILRVLELADFAMGATPADLSVQRTKTGTYSVTATAVGGFTSPITLTVRGIPANATFSFSKNPILPGETSIFSITPATNTPLGTVTLSFDGNG